MTGSAPLDALGLEASSLPDGAKIAFERLASLHAGSPCSLVATGDGLEAALRAWRDSPAVDELSLASQTPAGAVYHLTWHDAPPDFLAHVRSAGGVVRSAVARGAAWTFELRFPDAVTASTFYGTYARDHAFDIEALGSNETSEMTRGSGPTTKQREALRRAFEAGYFEVPRRTTMADIAAELDISTAALSQRLRRGITSYVDVDDLYSGSPGDEPRRDGGRAEQPKHRSGASRDADN